MSLSGPSDLRLDHDLVYGKSLYPKVGVHPPGYSLGGPLGGTQVEGFLKNFSLKSLFFKPPFVWGTIVMGGSTGKFGVETLVFTALQTSGVGLGLETSFEKNRVFLQLL